MEDVKGKQSMKKLLFLIILGKVSRKQKVVV
jgi:hypothetical protein